MDMQSLIYAITVAAIVLGAFAGLIKLVQSILYICEPNEVLVFSGRRHRTADGRDMGFRVVHGGRAFRIPILEEVERIDMSLISVPMHVRGAYSQGGIPLSMAAVANVKIASDPRLVGNAIERFLGHSRADIARVAKETLEGHLRGVLATMTPEEVNEDRLKFADRLAEEAGDDLRKLGLQLDTLKIQAVSDDAGYLENLGRTRIAEIIRAAEVAESDAVRAAEEAEAAAAAQSGVAETSARTQIQRKANELRQYKAKLEAQAKSTEEKAEQNAQAAHEEALRSLQTIRGELEQLRNTATIEVQAETERRVRELIAEGQAAAIAENGRAVAEALDHVNAAWQAAGDRAMDLVVVQQLDELFTQAAEAAAHVQPEHVTLLDGGDGKTVASYARAYPATVAALLDEIAATLGVDVKAVLNGRGDRSPKSGSPASDTAPKSERAA